MAVEILLTGLCILSPIYDACGDVEKVALNCPQIEHHKAKVYIQTTVGTTWSKNEKLEASVGLDGRHMLVVPGDRIAEFGFDFVDDPEDEVIQVQLDNLIKSEYFGHNSFCPSRSNIDYFVLMMEFGSLTSENWLVDPESDQLLCFESDRTGKQFNAQENAIWRVEAKGLKLKIKSLDNPDHEVFELNVALDVDERLRVVISNDVAMHTDGEIHGDEEHWRGAFNQEVFQGRHQSLNDCEGNSADPICHFVVDDRIDRTCTAFYEGDQP